MTPPRVEPPEGLRDRDGWHWLETQVPANPPYIAQLPWFWAATNQTWRYGETMERTPDELAQVGWRYASPCLTPAEVAALRDERDDQVAAATELSADVTVFTQRCDVLTEERDALQAGAQELHERAVSAEHERNAAAARAEALVAGVEPLDNFAWSCVRCDHPEAQKYLSELRENMRAALAAFHAASSEAKP